MSSILVIGGAGYIGSVFIEQFMKKYPNKQIVILDDLSTTNEKNINPKAKFYKGSQLDSNILNKIIKEEKVDFIFHFAAKLIVSESVFMPIEYFKNNLVGVLTIIEVMKQNNLKNIIFSSTAAVYGDPKKNPIDEESEKNPINPYGSSKLACEFLLNSVKVAYDINSGILRYFNVAGASDSLKYGSWKENPTLLIPVINKSIINNKKMYVYGNDYKNTKDGSCVRDYIHVVDLADAHILLMEYMLKNNKSETINLGTKNGYTVLEVIKEAEKVLNKKINYEINNRRPGDPELLLTNNKKAKEILGWIPKKTLKDMIISDYEFQKRTLS